MDSIFGNDYTIKKNSLSAISEKSYEDGNVDLNTTQESQRHISRNMVQGFGDSYLRYQHEFSDSEFRSSTQGMNILERDEAERLQFQNSNAESFSDRVDGETSYLSRSRLNTTGKVPDESMGTYFLRRSSHPMKDNQLDSSRFQKICDETDRRHASGLQIKPRDTSTPKSTHRHSRGNGYPASQLTNTSAIPFNKSELNRESRRWSTQSTGDPNKSFFVESMLQTDGSMSAMAKFLRGPESVGITKQDLFDQILQYCQARNTDVSAVSGLNDNDVSFSEFRDNLVPDSENSAASSKSVSLSDFDVTIVGKPSSPVTSTRKVNSVTDCLDVKKSELSKTPVSKDNLTPYPPGFPYVVQIQYHYHGDCGCKAGPSTSTCSATATNHKNVSSTSGQTPSIGVVTVLQELQDAIENAKKHFQLKASDSGKNKSK